MKRIMRVIKFGCSLAIVVPVAVLKRFEAKLGDYIEVDFVKVIK